MPARQPVRVLVTGAGSGVGQGVVKALRISGLPVTVVSADISPMNASLYVADEAAIIPKVESKNALEGIAAVLNERKIDVVMIGSEFDLAFFSSNKSEIESRTSCRVIVSPPETVAIADDKWLTAEFLRANGLPYAESSLAEDAEEAAAIAAGWGFPVMLKTRRGTSSRHVHIVRSTDELSQLWKGTPNPMLQKLVDIPTSELQNEYTCSVFRTATGAILGPFHARRTLRGGTSWHVEVAPFPELNPVLLGIADKLKFEGTMNVQLMIGPTGPVPFELNARFSGTTAVRAHFGFNEPEMTLRSFHYGEKVDNPAIRTGIAMRYHEEVFLEGVDSRSLVPNVTKGIVRDWF